MKTVCYVFIAIVISLLLIGTGDAAPARCAGTSNVDCYIRKWRPKALQSGICLAAIRCVRAKMLQKVLSDCTTDDDLGEFMGSSTPSCVVAKCIHLAEDDSKKLPDGGNIPVQQPAVEPAALFVPDPPRRRFPNWWYYFSSSEPSNM